MFSCYMIIKRVLGPIISIIFIIIKGGSIDHVHKTSSLIPAIKTDTKLLPWPGHFRCVEKKRYNS